MARGIVAKCVQEHTAHHPIVDGYPGTHCEGLSEVEQVQQVIGLGHAPIVG